MLADRLAAQLLAGPPATDPVAVVERLLAVQSQELRGARLAVRSRTTGVADADLDRALGVDRTLVVSWYNRGTLHLVRAEDHPWLHALTAPTIVTANARRLHQEGVSLDQAERGVAVIEAALTADGPLGRRELGARLHAAGIPTKGQALVHLLMAATLAGHVVRGPVQGKEQAFVLVRDWLPPAPPFDRDRAVAELARRFLAGHGPADDRDLAKWSGLPLGVARAGLGAIGSQLAERADGLADLRDRPPTPPLPEPRLLGSFEPVLMGWTSRAWVLGDDIEGTGVVTSNGIFRPIALVEGRAVATWGLADGRVTLRPFAPLARRHRDALAVDADAVLAYLGLPRREAMVVEGP